MTDDRRRAYESTLSAVDHSPNPVASERSILTTLAAHGSHTPDVVRKALRAAVENGDLVRTLSGYVRPDESDLLATIEREVEATDTDQETIARCNAALADVRSPG